MKREATVPEDTPEEQIAQLAEETPSAVVHVVEHAPATVPTTASHLTVAEAEHIVNNAVAPLHESVSVLADQIRLLSTTIGEHAARHAELATAPVAEAPAAVEPVIETVTPPPPRKYRKLGRRH